MPTTPIVADAKLCDTEGDLGELESFFGARFNPGIGVGIVQESAPFGCDFGRCIIKVCVKVIFDEMP